MITFILGKSLSLLTCSFFSSGKNEERHLVKRELTLGQKKAVKVALGLFAAALAVGSGGVAIYEGISKNKPNTTNTTID